MGMETKNFATIRRIALDLPKLDAPTQKSIIGKRHLAAWDGAFLETIIKI